MPWKETCVVKERLWFVDRLESGLYTMTELCGRYGISRKMGSKWAERFVAGGVEGLADQSRAPQHCPHRLGSEVREELHSIRRKHPLWGPRKLLGYLQRRQPEWVLAAPSTVGDLLRREGLVLPRRRRRRRPSPPRPWPRVVRPNDLWSVDFKGELRTRDGHYCHPLAVVDRCSQYPLQCRGLRSTATAGTRRWMERSFREFGLPPGILCDNRLPFGSQALWGLSRLSV